MEILSDFIENFKIFSRTIALARRISKKNISWRSKRPSSSFKPLQKKKRGYLAKIELGLS